MRAWDEAYTQSLLQTINRSEKFSKGRFRWSRIAISQLLSAGVPFAEIHFDPVHPGEFSSEEKDILREWFERGGFLLAFEDTYPYEQEEFRKKRTLPIFDFLTQELPRSDPRYTVQRADDTSPFFHALYETVSIPSIQREMRENPNYRGRTMLLLDGRVVAFFMGRYGRDVENRWASMPRPLVFDFSTDVRSYYLIINIYVYALTH